LDHFCVAVPFDPTTPTIFERVVVYDSLNSNEMISSQSRVSTRSGIGIPTNSRGAQYLMQLQCFLNEFSFYENKDVYNTLKQDPKFILCRATYNSCPQQSNGYDCSLFGFATLLHIAHGIKVDETIFNQANITELRGSLYTIFSSDIRPDPKKFLAKTLSKSFFPLLGYKDVDGAVDTHIQFTNTRKTLCFQSDTVPHCLTLTKY
jgi:hypothetical protein